MYIHEAQENEKSKGDITLLAQFLQNGKNVFKCLQRSQQLELKNSHIVHVYMDFFCFKNAFISVPFRKCETHFYLNNKKIISS